MTLSLTGGVKAVKPRAGDVLAERYAAAAGAVPASTPYMAW